MSDMTPVIVGWLIFHSIFLFIIIFGLIMEIKENKIMPRLIDSEYCDGKLCAVTVIDDDEDEAVGLTKVTYCKDCKSSHFDSVGGVCTIRKDMNDNPLKVSPFGYCDSGKSKV
jgi:hypothetical protein